MSYRLTVWLGDNSVQKAYASWPDVEQAVERLSAHSLFVDDKERVMESVRKGTRGLDAWSAKGLNWQIIVCMTLGEA